MEALQVDERITPITTIKRHRAAGRVRHRPRSYKTAGVEVRSSSRTSTSTRNPRPTPAHPHSTLKSPFNPQRAPTFACNSPAQTHPSTTVHSIAPLSSQNCMRLSHRDDLLPPSIMRPSSSWTEQATSPGCRHNTRLQHVMPRRRIFGVGRLTNAPVAQKYRPRS